MVPQLWLLFDSLNQFLTRGKNLLTDTYGRLESIPDWDEVGEQFFSAGLNLNPSTLHGALVGLYAAGFNLYSESEANSTVAALEKTLSLEFQGALAEFVIQFSVATALALQNTDYTFTPLLPGDEEELKVRLLSVSEWSTGVLSGFTQGVTILEATGKTIPEVTADSLKDFAVIAQVDTSEVECEETEKQLDEIIDYLRFAVINIVEETQSEQELVRENIEI